MLILDFFIFKIHLSEELSVDVPEVCDVEQILAGFDGDVLLTRSDDGAVEDVGCEPSATAHLEDSSGLVTLGEGEQL